jgi:chemotaxis protein MotB
MIGWTRKSVWAIALLALAATGCARHKELEKVNREQASTIRQLNDEIARLSAELESLARSREDLSQAKADLEKKLKAELAGGDLSISMGSRGLVLTVLNRILFDSGKAEIKNTAQGTLDKVAEVLRKHAGDQIIYVEGHTDNQPIRYSGWKSNWELSTARATEVIHYLSENGGVEAGKFIAAGYGEYHPVHPNDSLAHKEKNRRVEIVISPRKVLGERVEMQSSRGASLAGGSTVE